MKEGEEVGREEGPHGILPGGLLRRVRGDCARSGSGSGTSQATQAWQGSYLHRCAGRDRVDDARRTRTRSDLRHLGEASDSKQEPAVEIEIIWCPAQKGIPGNEVADEWAKLAASEPDDLGVE